jgi:hypothetical protein
VWRAEVLQLSELSRWRAAKSGGLQPTICRNAWISQNLVQSGHFVSFGEPADGNGFLFGEHSDLRQFVVRA